MSGRDTRAFLHAQLTRDLLSVGTGQAALAAWLDAKGRVLTLLEVVPAATDWLLVLPADLAESVLERLGRYVLRADVRLALDRDVAVHAVLGEATSWLADRGVELAAAPWSLTRNDTIAWLRVGPELVRALGPAEAVAAALRDLPAADAGAVDLAEIGLGLPRIDAASSEKYVAQMLNLDRLGAISFDKGCYPGQEIVARTQHLGSVKRRLARFGARSGPLPPPGTPLTDAAGEHAGEVVRAARSAAGMELLAVVRSESTGLRLASGPAEAPPLEQLGLPDAD